MKKRTLSIMMAAIMTITSLLGTTAFAAEKKDATAASNVKTKTIKKTDKYLETQAKYPSFSDIADKKELTRLNKSVETYVKQYQSALLKEAKAYYKDAKKEGWEFRKYGLWTSFTTHFSGNALTSVLFNASEYTGGAHPNHMAIGYNIDMKTGKNYKLSEIFKSDFDYKNLLNNEIKEQIKTSEYADSITFETVTENTTFYFTKDALNIVFQSYEIAPYSMGQPTYAIPMEKLSAGLAVEVK